MRSAFVYMTVYHETGGLLEQPYQIRGLSKLDKVEVKRAAISDQVDADNTMLLHSEIFRKIPSYRGEGEVKF